MDDTLRWVVLGLMAALFGITALLWAVLWRTQAPRPGAPKPDPASLAWLQEQYDRMTAAADAQRAADLKEIRRRLRQQETYAQDVTETYQRLCTLYNAMRRYLAVLDAQLGTWPEVRQGLPTYSAADPPPLPVPPWLQEDAPS